MALKPVVYSRKTDEVPLTVGGKTCFVRVRHITRAHDDELHKAAIKRTFDEKTRSYFDAEDNETYSLNFFRAAVLFETKAPSETDQPPGWRALTPEILGMLVELPDGYTPRLTTETQTKVGEDGTVTEVEVEVVAFDAELAEFLWTQVRTPLFRDPLYVHAQAVLVTTQLRRELERGNSLGSSAA